MDHQLAWMRVTPEEVARRKAYLGISDEDEARIKAAHEILRRHGDEIIERFYAFLLSQPHTQKMLSGPGVVERLKKLQREYFDRLTQGVYDLDYFQNRILVGQAHDRAGLTPEWYLGAYQRYVEIMADVLRRNMSEGFFETYISISRVVFLDMGLAMDAYIYAREKSLQERTRELQELDSKKRLLSETIVHDLRNPVAGIQGFLWALKAKPGALGDSERRALVEAERACATLDGMVDNVLDISRMEDKALKITMEELDVREVVGEVAGALEPYAAARGKVIRRREPAGPVRARTDRVLLRRILFNLVINSIRHAGGASYVEVEASSDAPGRARLVVSDDGSGIPADLHGAILDKFGGAKLRKSGTKFDTGLGLVFCRMAIQELGGRLELDSDRDKGARFSVVV